MKSDNDPGTERGLLSQEPKRTGISFIRFFFLMSGFLLLTLLPTKQLNAQIYTGGVTGTVKDASGAVVPDTKITLTNDQTGVVQTAMSTAAGVYNFQAVNSGTYTLQAEHSGFNTFVTKNIEVSIQHASTVDVNLTAGSVKQEVTVTATAPLVQAESAEVGTTIQGTMVNDLPLNGRGWASLAQLSAGVTTANTAFSGAANSAYFVVNGVNLWEADFRLNGVDDNVEFYGGESSQTHSNVNVSPPPDAIAEFRMENNDYSAEFGHSNSAVINAVMKSGTNKYHGDLWDYVRNNKLDSNDFFSNLNGKPIAPLHQNQFGFTVGGPISIPKLYDGKNRSFFFFDYQGDRIVQSVSKTNTVPTALMRSSGYTNLEDLIAYNAPSPTNAGTPKIDGLGRKFPLYTIMDPATTRAVAGNSADPVSGLTNPSASTIYVRDPFYAGGSIAGMTDFTAPATWPLLNQIPSGRLDKNAVALMNLYPTANVAGWTNDSFVNYAEPISQNRYDLRIDESLGSRDTFFGTLDWSHIHELQPNNLPGLANGATYATGNTYIPVWGMSIGYTHMFSPSMANELHVGYSRNDQILTSFEANQTGIPAQFGIQGVPQYANNGGLPKMTVSGLSSLGVASSMPVFQYIYDAEIIDNVTKVRGKHTLKTGIQILKIEADLYDPSYPRGSFSYNGQWSDVPNKNNSVLGMVDMLLTPAAATVTNGISNLGGLSSFQASAAVPVNDHRWYEGAYFMDDIKATSNLTLNLGLRWDYFNSYSEEDDGNQANLVQSNGGNGPTGTYYIPQSGCGAPRSAAFNAEMTADNITIVCTSNKSLQNMPKLSFAPRLGFAYRLKPTWVIRGGYGLSYGGMENIGGSQNMGYNYPFNYTNTLTSSNSYTPFNSTNSAAGGATYTLENALGSVNLQNPLLVNPVGLTLTSRQFNWANPYTENFNLTTQWQFTKADSIQVAYVGTLGRHLDSFGTHNATSEILPPGSVVLNYVAFSNLAANTAAVDTSGSSLYHSMQVTVEHRTTHGLTLLGNYVLSRCRSDNLWYAVADQNFRAQWLPGFGEKSDYGLCDTDAFDVVHLSGRYSLPVGRGGAFLKNANGIVDAFIGGWQTNWIYTFQSGSPFSVTCPTATTANFGCYANVVSGQDMYAGAKTRLHWINAAAFSNPPVATTVGQTDFSPLGGAPYQARGPHFTNLDFSVFKDFSIEQYGRLEFRAEAFNFFNTTQFRNPSGLNFNNLTTFGQITALRGTATGANRIFQLALKYYF